MSLEITKELILHALKKCIEDKSSLDEFHKFTTKIFLDDDDSFVFEKENYKEIMCELDDYLDLIESKTVEFDINIFKRLYTVIENDLLDPEYIYFAYNYEKIETMYNKWKKEKVTYDDFSSYLNKYSTIDVAKVLEIYESNLLK